MENNPTLQKLSVVRNEKIDEKMASFFLDEFKESNEEPNHMKSFINYICANLKLLSYLVKGRNLKSMKKVNELDNLYFE